MMRTSAPSQSALVAAVSGLVSVTTLEFVAVVVVMLDATVTVSVSGVVPSALTICAVRLPQVFVSAAAAR